AQSHSVLISVAKLMQATLPESKVSSTSQSTVARKLKKVSCQGDFSLLNHHLSRNHCVLSKNALPIRHSISVFMFIK
ncbi:MAG: hypothetical protein R6U02_03320, partial [Alkalibacterium sp.]